MSLSFNPYLPSHSHSLLFSQISLILFFTCSVSQIVSHLFLSLKSALAYSRKLSIIPLPVSVTFYLPLPLPSSFLSPSLSQIPSRVSSLSCYLLNKVSMIKKSRVSLASNFFNYSTSVKRKKILGLMSEVS